MKDAFDLWWEWAEKPLESPLVIDEDVHTPVKAMVPEARHDRGKVNQAVQEYRAQKEKRPDSN